MWSLLWILPPVFLVWALVLVIRKVRKAGEEEESAPASLEERLAALDDMPDEHRNGV